MIPDSAIVEENGKPTLINHIKFSVVHPKKPDGTEWDQTQDAVNNIRHAATLDIPHIALNPGAFPLDHRAVIVGGGPSIESELENIRALAADKRNHIFALNWAHTWLLKQGIPPDACVLFEIDVDPCGIIEAAHPDTTYYICTHCHPLTAESLKGHKRVLWNTPPNSPGEEVALNELFPNEVWLGGGVATFLRTVSLALALGYRNFDVFGCDSSFPDDAKTTHVNGYPTIVSPEIDSMWVYAYDEKSGAQRRFRTVAYLAYQTEEFKAYCKVNHVLFKMRVHGDTLLGFLHRMMWAHQYEDATNAPVS